MGDVVMNGTLVAAIPIALFAGLASFVSPCVLPLLPGYVAYIGGFSRSGERENRRRLLVGVVLFVVGFSFVFVVLTGAVGALGWWVARWSDLIVRILGGVVIAMGLVFMGRVAFLQRIVKPSWRPVTGLVGAPLLGIAFGIGWTPCLGPTATTIVVAAGFSWATRSVIFIKRHIAVINRVGGILLVLLGVAMVAGLWTDATDYVAGAVTGLVPPL